jgi:hypothetical protein
LTGITLLKVCAVYIALFITKLGIKVIKFPILTFFCQRRTLFKVLVPLSSVSARRYYAFSGFLFKERSIRSTRTSVIFFEESMIYLTLIDTLFKCKVILLPDLTFLRFRRTFELVFVPFASIFTLRLNTCQ